MKNIKVYIFLILCFLSISFSAQSQEEYKIVADTLRIKDDLIQITKTEQSRNYKNIETLNGVASYIYEKLSKNCDTVYYQTFLVNGVEYKNVIGSIGIKNSERIILGAHYDVAGEQEGADDNASGVVGIIELSRMLAEKDLKYRIDFVAYSLEEPPFFGTDFMGSNIHAKSLKDENVTVKGMVCLEMIGYFNDAPRSQSYPLGLLKLFYGGKGNYITIVRKFGKSKFAKDFTDLMKGKNLLPTKLFKGPSQLPGVDFSDHRNYWKYGFSAVMITNTAFYRNINYHKKTDTMETLDIARMALVIDEVYYALLHIK